MPSFDIVSEIERMEIENAVNQAVKELATRFDFKGSSAKIELTKPELITLTAEDANKLKGVREIMVGKLAKRGVDTRFLDFSATPQKLGGDKLKLAVPVKSGIDAETARKIQGLVKASKLKVQSQVQGDSVRITGGKRDELQAAIALLKKDVTDVPLAFNNFRD
jgi:uncharacterized protein YajQ (UPF0234 family)